MANRSSQRTLPSTLRRLGLWAFVSGAALLLVAVSPTLELAYISMIPLGATVMSFIITANSMLQATLQMVA